MKKSHWLVLTGSCFLLDVATKVWVATRLPIHQEIEVIPGFFSITPITNNGIAFSLFAGSDSMWRTMLLTAAAAVSWRASPGSSGANRAFTACSAPGWGW
jgi:signal peptidase II